VLITTGKTKTKIQDKSHWCRAIFSFLKTALLLLLSELSTRKKPLWNTADQNYQHYVDKHSSLYML